MKKIINTSKRPINLGSNVIMPKQELNIKDSQIDDYISKRIKLLQSMNAAYVYDIEEKKSQLKKETTSKSNKKETK